VTSGSRDEFSAGGVVYRRGEEGIEVVLVGRRRERLWALPKGKPDGDEAPEETALREVREETGLEARIEQPLGDVAYWYTGADGQRVHKKVTYYLMQLVGGDVADHDHEFDDVAWVHLSEAERLLTHRNQLHILRRVAELTDRAA
jgi:8-oxo-dGTP pyrophosphatase MutT (NUDIX family)